MVDYVKKRKRTRALVAFVSYVVFLTVYYAFVT